ncbi:hypothetical protein M501DRAFT_1010364 [Patellaria atrata CBS 101060]|uniref:Uncharacterized protein n=1 Tax=Patellaria atrata CBS 101060 TaxID=1346257 RepID=A0A9P4SCJ2_9PEZI|nr:hypothetical protein M501DRAFT_1010364 [Patellaria atrata CBS 101060]
MSRNSFSFPPLPAGPPTTYNWYQALIDHPDCQGDPQKIQEAYSAFRSQNYRNAVQSFTSRSPSAPVSDTTLISHLKRQKILKSHGVEDSMNHSKVGDNERETQNVNCLVVWLRPSAAVLDIVMKLQLRIAEMVDGDLHMIPLGDMHISLLELSHRHTVTHLEDVAKKIGEATLLNILDYPSKHSSKPRLVAPRINFDKAGIALSFLPSQEDDYTYHHLRNDMHKLALQTGIEIDTCYTAPTAHITFGRFVDTTNFRTEVDMRKFLDLVENLNTELSTEYGLENGSPKFEWIVANELSAELQSGYVKFGRAREKATLLGRR